MYLSIKNLSILVLFVAITSFVGGCIHGENDEVPVARSFAHEYDSLLTINQLQLDSLTRSIAQRDSILAAINEKAPVNERVTYTIRGLRSADVDSLADRLWADPR